MLQCCYGNLHNLNYLISYRPKISCGSKIKMCCSMCSKLSVCIFFLRGVCRGEYAWALCLLCPAHSAERSSMGAAPKLSDVLRPCSSRGRGLSVCFADSGSSLQHWPLAGWLQKVGMSGLTKVEVLGQPCVLTMPSHHQLIGDFDFLT